MLAVVSAALFGASTPLAKLLLGSGVNPWLLAGLLYVSSGMGLAAVRLARYRSRAHRRESALAPGDYVWFALAVTAGGIAGPVLLMLGLARTDAATAALLLNLEGIGTMALAWIVFRENVDRRVLTGAMAILAGAVLLSWQSGAREGASGAIFIALACFAWAVDNNLTRKISGADPVQLAMLKGLIAGGVNLLLAWHGHALRPSAGQIASASLIGFFGYGVSLVLFVLALRDLGAARTSAYFSTAPFIGALVAIALFGSPLTGRLALAGMLMLAGVWLHLTEVHDHVHVHEVTSHSHRHTHDDHHQHTHGPSDPPGEPHAHWHHHERLTHRHPHYPDLHHTHDH
jgi:drug/metabolite transporter (DMT)-like permease